MLTLVETLTDARRRLSEQCNSNETRGMICGGYLPGGQVNQIDYITIASGGNAVDFGGDLTGTSVYGGNVVIPQEGDCWWIYRSRI